MHRQLRAPERVVEVFGCYPLKTKEFSADDVQAEFAGHKILARYSKARNKMTGKSEVVFQ
jgi:hypothetical protein